MAESKLYVIFHGSWAFVDNTGENFITAYAPHSATHTYMAGSWLGEVKFQQGARLALEVHAEQHCAGEVTRHGGDTVRGHKNGFILFPEHSGCPAGDYYAAVTLPRPTWIHPELVIPNVPVRFDPESATVAQMENLGLVPVFEYRTKGKPALSDPKTGFYWEPAVPGPNSVTTLHLFAADDTVHAIDQEGDFAAVAAILGSPKATMINGSQSASAADKKVKIPDLRGREYEITTFLFERVNNLRAIGSQMEYRGEEAALFWNPPMPLPVSGLLQRHQKQLGVADLASCGGGGGGS